MSSTKRSFENKGVIEMSQHIWKQSSEFDQALLGCRPMLTMVCIVAQDDLHPVLGSGYVKSGSSHEEMWRSVCERDRLVRSLYKDLKNAFIRNGRNAAVSLVLEQKFRCVALCESESQVLAFFQYQHDCGCIISTVSDIDFFFTSDYAITTWAPEYSSFASYS